MLLSLGVISVYCLLCAVGTVVSRLSVPRDISESGSRECLSKLKVCDSAELRRGVLSSGDRASATNDQI